jgi:flagellar secretion chaperone FliS
VFTHTGNKKENLMYPQPKAIASYGRVANIETNPLTQVVMLYDGAIKFLSLTAQDIENKDIVAKAEHSNRALDIIHYLQSILDFDRGGSVAVSLDKLYRSVAVLILRASAELDPKLMRRAAELLKPVRDAWEANAQNSRAPIASLESVLEGANAQKAQISQMF